MIKKFFVAVILGLLVMSSQIAAAYEYDWNSAPRIGSKAQFARYIESERRKGNTIFPVVLTNGLIVYNQSELDKLGDKISNSFVVYSVSLDSYGFGSGRILCKIREYPGTRVANAYLSINQHQAWMNLTNEEQNLYDIAVGIVDEANKRSSEVEKARYIHDEICKRVKDYKDENDRNKTAIGALIDCYAQCGGFTDAFYMLGRMSGLNVGRIGGTASGGKHGWNWITFSDGRSYCIDVTNGFKTKGTYLFCATKERMEKTHSCDWEIIPNLQ